MALRTDQTEPARRRTLHQLLTHSLGAELSVQPGITQSDGRSRYPVAPIRLAGVRMTDVCRPALSFIPHTLDFGRHLRSGPVIEVVSGKSLEASWLTKSSGPLAW